MICPSCKAEIADHVSRCPRCMATIPETPKKRRNWYWWYSDDGQTRKKRPRIGPIDNIGPE